MKDLKFKIRIDKDGKLNISQKDKSSLRQFKGMQLEMILHPLSIQKDQVVEMDEQLWLKAAANNEVLSFLEQEPELYSLKDGQKFKA